MRLHSLALTRYGRFTDAILPFGPRRGDAPDLHIVYGDNEAGKTTMLNAIVDLLFGMEAATPYKFLHPAAALKIGGALEFEDGVHQVERPFKSPSLLDADGRPLPEGLFSPHLAGLDRASFKMMFSLDEKTLAAGGESILASKGELGALLFSASSGLSDFSNALGALRSETEAFYRTHARKHGLAELKKALAALKERKSEIDMLAAPFARLIAARATAQDAYAAASRERADGKSALVQARRKLVALPRIAEWRAVQDDHDALADLAGVPPGWAEELPGLQRQEIELAARRDGLIQEVERLAADVAALTIDEPALAAAPRVRRAADTRDRYTGALKDLPDRRLRLEGASEAIGAILSDIGMGGEAPRDLVLRADAAKRLRDELEALSLVTASVATTGRELELAQGRLAEGDSAVASLGARFEEGAGALAAALAAAEADDSEARLRLGRTRLRSAQETAATRLAALAPWRGDAEALEAAMAPSEQERGRLADDITASQGDVRETTRELESFDGEVVRLGAEIAVLERDEALVTDAEAERSRAAREAAWDQLKGRLDAVSAEAFETALRRDDAVGVARLATASGLAELRALRRAHAARSAERERAAVRLKAASNRLDGAKEAAAARASAAGLTLRPQDDPLSVLEAFCTRRERAREALANERDAWRDADAAGRDHEAIHDRLRSALAGAGHAPDGACSLDELKGAARQALERVSKGRNLVAQRDKAREEVRERRLRSQEANDALEAWTTRWGEACKTTWLGDREVAYVRRILPRVAELGVALDGREAMAERIRKMEQDQEAFARQAGAIARDLGIADEGDPLALIEAIERRVEAATAVADRRAARIADLEDARARLHDVEAAAATAGRRAAEMKDRFGAADLADVAAAIATRLRKDALAQRLREIALEVLSTVGSRTIGEAEALTASLDRAALEREVAALEADTEHRDERLQALFAQRSAAEDAVAAVGADEEAARLEEERRTLLLDIEAQGLAHLSLRSGIIAAEQAVRLYRERHRGTMMVEASDLFARLSRGAYTGLTTLGAKDGETLVGLPAGGGSKLATEMSTATRSQLYLALRIAGYREFVKTRRPVPLVLDDVLETFDDARAEASLDLLADLSKVGQVIYLTHHRHLCAIAARVCPDVRVHDLGLIA